MPKNLDHVIDGATEYGGAAMGAVIGAGVGSAVAGPLGTAGGALAGAVIENIMQWAGAEIKARCLSKAEARKVGSVYEKAKEKITEKLQAGEKLRTDGFIEDGVDDRSASEEILEGTLFAAQRENEEKKLPYLANLYANINFDSVVDRNMANQLIRIASDLTYRQLVIMRVIGAYQTGDLKGAPLRRNTPYGKISGYDNISIAGEIYDLYRKSLVFSQTFILDSAGINPSKLVISGMGALLYNLMDLPHMSCDNLSKSIIDFLSDQKETSRE